MEKIISASAKFVLLGVFYDFYSYYKIKQIEHEMKTSINLDLSFENLSPELNNKNLLIATSLKSLNQQKENNKYLYVKSQLENVDNMNDRKNIIHFFVKNPIEAKLNTSEQNIDQNLTLFLNKYRVYKYFDPVILKAEVVKDKASYNIENYEKLNIVDKLKLLTLWKNSKKIMKFDKGFLQGQRILIYGKLKYSNNEYKIYPKYFLGSGTTEFEDLVEFTKTKINHRLFNLTLILFSLGLVHFTYNNFFKKNKY